jgi:hypothetical protein
MEAYKKNAKVKSFQDAVSDYLHDFEDVMQKNHSMPYPNERSGIMQLSSFQMLKCVTARYTHYCW